ncbi:MAG: hypothetical protein LAO51_04945 [Acidobacteriia bacterium]|nr:hypothetical protein [Terriglobia bacterium]
MLSRSARVGWLESAGILVALTLGCLLPAVASGDRLLVNVPEPFELDGRMFPAGVVSLRHIGDYNPTTAIDRITVGVEDLGMHMAQRVPREAGFMAGSAVFERSPKGHLLLVGYTTSRDPSEVFLYRHRERGETFRLALASR